MKLGVCNEMFENVPWEKVCEIIAAYGFDGVEIAPFTFATYVTEIGAEKRREIRRTAERAGLEVIGLHWLLAKTEGMHVTHPDPAVRARTAEYLVSLVQFCADVGGRVLVFGSPKQRDLLEGVDFEQGIEFAAAVFERALAEAERAGVVIAFEPLSPAETNFGNNTADGARLVERVGHPNFRLHLDAKAMASDKRPMDELVRSYYGLLEHVHVNDVNLLGPGMGELDLRPLVDALTSLGYDKFASIEVFRTDPGPEAILRESKAYLDRLLARHT